MPQHCSDAVIMPTRTLIALWLSTNVSVLRSGGVKTWTKCAAMALLQFPLSRFYCFSCLTLLALQLGITPAAGQSADVTELVVCGDARPLVCDGDVPVATVFASTERQQEHWSANDSCAGGCYYVVAFRFGLYSIFYTFCVR